MISLWTSWNNLGVALCESNFLPSVFSWNRVKHGWFALWCITISILIYCRKHSVRLEIVSGKLRRNSASHVLLRSLLRRLPICVSLYYSWFSALAVRTSFGRSPDIAHHPLFARTDRAILIKGWYSSFAVEATNLKLAKLHVKVRNKVLKDVSTLSH